VRTALASFDTDDGGDFFGEAVAADGGLAFVTARSASVRGTAVPTGATYVFERADGEWRQRERITLESGDAVGMDEGFRFGTNVAASSGLAVVIGSDGGDSTGPSNGEAYVFGRSGEEWQQEGMLSSASNDAFGEAVATTGDRIVVGAPFGPAVYVFDREDGEWTQTTRLAPEAETPQDRFGESVALDGETVFVGAPERSADGAGAVDVFDLVEGEWTRTATLPSEPDEGDVEVPERAEFGTAVALDGDRAVVSAPGYGTADERSMGMAYAFARADGEWTLEARLAPSDLDNDDRFGTAVALDGETALVGAARDEGPGGGDAGTAYLFTRREDGWAETAKLVSPSFDGTGLGTTGALGDDFATVGALDATETESGSAFVFSV